VYLINEIIIILVFLFVVAYLFLPFYVVTNVIEGGAVQVFIDSA